MHILRSETYAGFHMSDFISQVVGDVLTARREHLLLC